MNNMDDHGSTSICVVHDKVNDVIDAATCMGS